MTVWDKIKSFFTLTNAPTGFLGQGQSGATVQRRVVTPGRAIWPLVSDASLIARYKSWPFVCASRNGQRVAEVTLRLYATTGETESRVREYCKARLLSESERRELETNNPQLMMNPRFKEARHIEEIVIHPFLELMRNINPVRDYFETMEETQIFIDLVGDAYWRIIPDDNGLPIAIQLLPSQFMTIVPGKDRFIEAYIFGATKNDPNSGIRLEPEEIIHFRRPNPRDEFFGMGCLEAVVEDADLYQSMQDTEKALNDNGAVPELIIQYISENGGTIPDDELKKLEADWNKAIQGVFKRGKNKVTDSRVEVKEVGFSPKDMQYALGRRWTRDAMAAAFGVPVALLTVENVNKANAASANYQYEMFSIKPRLSKISDKLNQDLIPKYNEPRLFCAFDDNVPQDSQFTLNKTTGLFSGGIIDRNEARQEFGYDPVPDADNVFMEPRPNVETDKSLTNEENYEITD